ncbi:hypothetical protein [Halobaculum roseum]|uniref:DUF4382 domain-containing protein n=1 Tax=Halobaculum roseum TaxID=2175149 RepID=A0ABD5MP19_9EURY|nr:hypothetical protein [Halobaculum roseum]QZY01942.1 hypothetical protein K6T36_11560 [Halobaculum roseum]
MTDRMPRRRLLAVAGSTLVGLAGCSQRDGGSPSETGSDSPGGSTDPDGPFERLAMRGTNLVIELREDSQVEQVNVIAPNGSRVRSLSVVTGETRLTVDLGVRYVPGTYEVTTEAGATASITLEPDLVIEELGVGANNPDVMPDSLDNFEPYAGTVVVRNEGTGPTAVQNLIFTGDVPNVTEDVRDSSRKSGIFDADEGVGERDYVLIPVEESVRLFSSTIPFSFAGQERTCSSMPEESTVIVQVEDTVRSEITEAAFDASYRPTSDNCDIAINRREE